jgi:response regulator NasT
MNKACSRWPLKNRRILRTSLVSAKRGIFAYIAGGHDPQELQSAIDFVLRFFSEYHALEGAFGRRAVTERANGILMERHDVDEQTAFQVLRDEARRTHRRIVDLAEVVATTRALLPSRTVAAEHPPVT